MAAARPTRSPQLVEQHRATFESDTDMHRQTVTPDRARTTSTVSGPLNLLTNADPCSAEGAELATAIAIDVAVDQE